MLPREGNVGMDRKSRRSVAVTAGLAAVLALSPVVAPAVTALAQDGDSTVSTQDAEKVTVTFEFGRGHDSVTKECEVNGQVDYPKPYPYEEDYTIEGWYYDEALTQKWYAGDHMSENTTLYAKWVDRYCTVTMWNETSYDDMTGVEPYYTKKVEYGGAFPRPDNPPAREGYKFEAWYADKKCTERYNFKNVKGDVNIYAKWTKFPTVTYYLSPDSSEACYEVVVDLNAGLDDQKKPLLKSAVTEHLGDTIPEGYTIEGFYTDPEYTNKFTNFASVDEDTTLYIKFDKQPVVTFDFNYDDVSNVQQSVNLFDYADAPEHSREGYELVGWYTDADCTEGNEYSFDIPVTGDMTLYAKWTPVVDPDPEPTPDPDPEPTPDPDPEPTPDPEPETKTFSVTLNDGLADTEDQVITIAEGETIDSSAIKAPTYDGWTFVGWFTDSDLTQEWDFSTPVTSDMTLWAGWLRNDVDGSGVTDDTETTTDDVEKDANKAEKDNDPAVPDTGDATVAVSGIAAVGAALTGAGALIRRRR